MAKSNLLSEKTIEADCPSGKLVLDWTLSLKRSAEAIPGALMRRHRTELGPRGISPHRGGTAVGAETRFRREEVLMEPKPANPHPPDRERELHPLLDYRHRRAYNRDVSMLLFPGALHAFTTMDDTLLTLLATVPGSRDGAGRSHAGVLPLLMLLQRQARSAFDLFAEGQAYQGWMLYRPALEAGLIVGKWLDDPTNAEIWHRRREDWKTYQATYQGKTLAALSLPRSTELQQVLSRLNDEFMHPNPDYVARHLAAEEGATDVTLWCFYSDDQVTTAIHLHSVLHLHLVLIDALIAGIGSKLPAVRAIPSHIVEFEEAFKGRSEKLRAERPDEAEVLSTLGLWPLPS